jgi:antirestriction protein ArdC
MTARDLYADITDRLIALIEADPGQMQLPWRRAGLPLSLPVNAATGNGYNGINIVSLWMAAEARGYTAPLWATFRQWLSIGAQVRKGEKASLVVFYKEFDAEPDPDSADDDGKRRMARASYVFNASQVDGFALPAEPELGPPIDRLDAADRFVAATGAAITFGGDRAYYRPATDVIVMPDEARFIDTRTMTRCEAFYATELHECVHWSGAESRLNRQFGKRFGDAAYAFEELVAELGAAFLCAELAITNDPRPDHAQYLAQWLAVLKADKRALFHAAAKASEAASYLKRLQPACAR